MAMVDVDNSSRQADLYGSSRLAWSEGQQPLGAVLHSSDEPVKSRNDFIMTTAP